MPIIIRAGFASTASGLVTIPTTQPPTPIPEIWSGLQFWITPFAPSAYESGQYSPTHPVVAWQNQFYYKYNDAAARLGAIDPTGWPYNYSHRTASFSLATWLPVSTAAPDLINGHPTITTNVLGHASYLSGQPSSDALEGLLSTPNYTYAIVYRAEAGCRGAMLGANQENLNGTIAGQGWLFGFGPTSNPGETIVQHKHDDRWVIAKNTATGTPCRAIVSGEGPAVNAWLKVGGVDNPYSHAFTGPRFSAGIASISLGSMGSADGTATQKRWIALIAQWNRVLAAEERAYLSQWLDDNFGPF